MAAMRTLGTTRPRASAQAINAFMRGVYMWMTVGLLLTAGVAYTVSGIPAVQQIIFQNSFLFFGLIIGELVLVFALAGAVHRMSPGMASGLFLLYSALNGLTLSAIFIVYAGESIFLAFVTAAGMFGAMTFYGLTTKKDLTSWGSFLFMGLIGVIIAMVVNIFLQSSAMQFVISVAGVIIFTGLTAYDTQQLRLMGDTAPDDSAAVQRATIVGALRLYLDFINLFLMLLRLFGGGRD